MKNIKIVFFGTPEFAVASLDALIAVGYDIEAVVTMPDKPGDRKNRLIQSDVKKYAVAHELRLLQPEKLKDPEFLHSLREINADLFIVIAFRMLPREVWEMPPMGTFNLHASLLPKYRGAAPINRAVMAGEKITGITTFLLKHEIDTGDILMQQSIGIADDEDAGSVHERLMNLGAKLTVETVNGLAQGTIKPMPQNEVTNAEPCPAPKIFRNDCKINWNTDALSIHNHIRGLAPYPGAWTVMTDDSGAEISVKVLKARPSEAGLSLCPGELKLVGGKVFAGTFSGPLELLSVQPAGKRAMAASDWLRGLRLIPAFC